MGTRSVLNLPKLSDHTFFRSMEERRQMMIGVTYPNTGKVITTRAQAAVAANEEIVSERLYDSGSISWNSVRWRPGKYDKDHDMAAIKFNIR